MADQHAVAHSADARPVTALHETAFRRTALQEPALPATVLAAGWPVVGWPVVPGPAQVAVRHSAPTRSAPMRRKPGYRAHERRAHEQRAPGHRRSGYRAPPRRAPGHHKRRHRTPRGGALGGRTPRRIARSLLERFGWARSQFRYLNLLWTRESGWNPHATNPYSGAYGIPQAVPGGKMASAGPNWRSSARTQIRWGLGYIKGRYGTPHQAWQHECGSGWY